MKTTMRYLQQQHQRRLRRRRSDGGAAAAAPDSIVSLAVIVVVSVVLVDMTTVMTTTQQGDRPPSNGDIIRRSGNGAKSSMMVDAFRVFSPAVVKTTSRSSSPASLSPWRCSSGATTSFFKAAGLSSSSSASPLFSSAEEEAKALLERARKMREELAALEGKSLEQVEEEARDKQRREAEIQKRAADERKAMKREREARRRDAVSAGGGGGKFLTVPETPEDQVSQAKDAVERAFRDGVTRQVVRFALVPEGETLMDEDRQWPGGAQQMYRRAAGPLTRDLLKRVRAPTSSTSSSTEETSDDDAGAEEWMQQQPNVTSQDVWDFDGSALVTAVAATGAKDDVQALVFPNTDIKYTRDIQEIDRVMKSRLFLLVNPFWRDVESWGFNLLSPNAKKLAQEVIFDGSFQETYVLLRKSVRGEECVALKCYPYDWQLYALAESQYWPYEPYLMHLGSTKDEPKSSEFTEFLSQHEEFKLSRNMRQMQRMMNNNNDE